MATSGIVGAVAGLWRFPVMSMRGELLEQAEFTEHEALSRPIRL